MRSLLPTSTPNGDMDDLLDTSDLVELYRFPLDRLWVRSMFISSADGAITGGSGRSGSLSTPGDRRVFALQRSLCDVVLVGAGTARAEGYLPVRPGEVDLEIRKRLLLDSTPPIAVVTRSPDWESPILQGGLAPTIIVTTDEAAPPPRSHEGIRVIRAGHGSVDLGSALDQLDNLGFRRIVCEGGPSLLAQIAAVDRLDELCLTVAPSLVAGPGRRMLEGPTLAPPITLSLAHLLEEDGALFARYLVDRGDGVG